MAEFILKILTGDQKGAEIELENRQTYSIGSSDDCQIILLSEGIADLHIEIVFLGEKINLLHCQLEVTLDNKPLPKLPTTMEAKQFLNLNGIILSFGSKDLDWDALTIEAEKAQQTPAESAKETITPQMKRKKTIGYGIGIALLSIGISLFAISKLVKEKQPETAITQETSDSPSSNEQIMEDIAGDSDFKNLTAEINDKGDIVLSGLVENEQTLKDIREMSSKINTRNVSLSSQIIEDLKLVLDEYNAGLIFNVTVEQDIYAVTVKGLFHNAENPEQLTEAIKENLPLLKSISIEVKPVSDLIQEVTATLQKFPQYSNIQLTNKNNQLRVSGTLLANYTDDLLTTLTKIFTKYEPHAYSFKNNLDVGPEFEGIVSSVLIGVNRFVIIEYNGKEVRAIVGTRLPNDFKVTDISREILELEYDGQKFSLPLS